MVFSSIPAYLDPPIWQQQPNQHEANRTESHHHQLVPPLPQQPHGPHVGGGAGSIIRPGSIADGAQAQAQAQLAKIPPPEATLKCPRCESTNTKFCYFNNYSLSQPRHFCKTCRRYWTRGGALRNVPVGGGYRRNKKNKRTRSKSPASNDKESSISNSTSVQIGQFPQSITNRPYVTSIQNLSRYGVGNIGLNLREIQAQTGHMGFQIGAHCSTADEGGVDQWRFQQFPFLNGFESTSAVSYPFQSEIVEAPSGLVGDVAATSRVTQLPSAKLEYNGGLNLSRSPLSISENNHYNSWTDLSALASSSGASRLL